MTFQEAGPYPVEVMDFRSGSRLGPYEILAPIGAGAMGDVYRARDERLGRLVAIKILPAGFANDAKLRIRFDREAKAISALCHPHICSLFDVGECDSNRYLVMEYCDGGTLANRITRGPLPIGEAIRYGSEIADALGKAHKQGIIHRDIKPSNIMLTEAGAKIVDFGLARDHLHDEEHGASTTSTLDRVLTEEGQLVGTVRYMAPEVLTTGRCDQRSDIYAFGLVLYEMLTGRAAFEASSRAGLIAAILEHEPRPIAEMRPDVDDRLARIVERCLSKNPEFRWQSAADIAAELRGIQHEPGKVGRLRRFLRFRAVPLWAILAVASLLTIAGSVLIWHTTRPGGAAVPRTAPSVAVLPFANFSNDANQQFFVDGMHDAVIANLSQIAALRVISRTSVMRYRNAQPPVRQIARELDVALIVEGSVVRVADRVRISVELIDGAADRHLWTKSYERHVTDVLALQSEVARSIAHEINVTLTPAERARLAHSRPINVAAYEATLRGDVRLSAGDSLRLSTYRRAIEHDPTYAPAWAGLALTYNHLSLYGFMAPSEAAAVARPAALKALELDPDLAEAYAALGTLRLRYDLDWSGAEAALRRAVVLKPGSAESLWWYAGYLTATGRDREAIETAKLYAKLDPLFADSYLGWIYLRTGHTDEAIAHYSKFVQISRVPWDVANLAVAYVVKGDAVRAAAECDSIGTFDDVATTGLCAWVYGNAGRRADAQKIIDGFKARRWVDPHFAAIAASGLHDREQVLYWLDRALVEHSPNLWGLRHATRLYFAFMRDDPKFRAFVARLHYPPGTFDR